MGVDQETGSRGTAHTYPRQVPRERDVHGRGKAAGMQDEVATWKSNHARSTTLRGERRHQTVFTVFVPLVLLLWHRLYTIDTNSCPNLRSYTIGGYQELLRSMPGQFTGRNETTGHRHPTQARRGRVGATAWVPLLPLGHEPPRSSRGRRPSYAVLPKPKLAEEHTRPWVGVLPMGSSQSDRQTPANSPFFGQHPTSGSA